MGGPRVRNPLHERIESFYSHVRDDERTPERLFLLRQIINTAHYDHFPKELVASIVWLMRRSRNSFYRHLRVLPSSDLTTSIPYDRLIDNLEAVFDSVTVKIVDSFSKSIQLDRMTISYVPILGDKSRVSVDTCIPVAMDAFMMCFSYSDFKWIRRKFGKDLSAWHHLYENYGDAVTVKENWSLSPHSIFV